MTATELAKLFHDTYERLSPDYGYETREYTKEFDVDSPNGKLMIAVCYSILNTPIVQQRLSEIKTSDSRERYIQFCD